MSSFRRLLCGLLTCALVLALPAVKAASISARPGDLDEQSRPQTALAFADAPRFPLSPENSLTLSSELSQALPGNLTDTPEQISTLDLTNHADDIWGRIRKGFGMTDLVSPVVDDRVGYYVARPQALRTMLERGRKYLYHIVVELEKRGMPTELALLPIVESAFNPQAMSSAKAAGLWQFIPSTGKDFQLTQNWWVDERRDVIASTNAALQYLQAIYEMHGDWHLALASYNWGEGAVARAINNNTKAGKPTDFNSLNMPAETRQYVPKLQALKQIIAHPEIYAIQLPAIPNRPYFRTVARRSGMDVAVAARLAEMPQSEFLALNPSYNRPVMPGSEDANLVLPVENAQKFEQNLARNNEPLLNWKTYSLGRSERVDQLARRLRLDLATLCSVNGLAPRARLAAGYTLLVPQGTDTALQEIVKNEPHTVVSAARQKQVRTTRTASKSVKAIKPAAGKAPRQPKLAHGNAGRRS